ncbi:hypothetical protein AAX26_01615 [Aliarcobacter thereius]|uniref:hypothetical protein n=1 Tax=Aliarcobacter thereius TaxID=544718 RepID=UPI000827E916|nr:hypothetical protein [Aliarcobacter thereius]OCL85966.1 hypothetical protein AAX26_01615 [Aliarcobacter thereius]
MKKIITSLFIYKSQLYSSTLDGNITQQNINTNYKNDGIEFNVNNYFEHTIVLDIKAYKDHLYILTRDGLYKYFDSRIDKIKNISDAQVITIDQKLKILFIISDSRGLIGLNLKNDNYIDDIEIELFNNGDSQVPITSITAHNGIIFLSILNSGIYRIDYKSKKSKFVYKQMQKIELKNPQELYYNKKNDELAIVDFDYGLILIKLENGNTSNYNLPNMDIPNSIKYINSFDRKYYVIQARNALYKFNIKNKEFSQIVNQKVSNVTTYYNKLYYTHNGELNIVNV